MDCGKGFIVNLNLVERQQRPWLEGTGWELLLAGLRGSCASRFPGLACGAPDREGAIPEMLFSVSDSASSCFMMAAFSPFCAFLGSLAYVFSTTANTITAVTTPMQRMLVIDACFLGKCGLAGSR